MPEYLSPGVYIEEIEIGAKPIEGVSTSTVGMVGATKKGPLNTPTLVTGFADFRRIFGGFLPEDPWGNARFLAYAVNGFFQNGGQRLYVTRIVGKGASPSEITLKDGIVTRLTSDMSPDITQRVSVKLASLRGINGDNATSVTFKEIVGVTTYEETREIKSYDSASNTIAWENSLEHKYTKDGTLVTVSAPTSDVIKVEAKEPGKWGADIQVKVEHAAKASSTMAAIDVQTKLIQSNSKTLFALAVDLSFKDGTPEDTKPAAGATQIELEDASELSVGDTIQFTKGATKEKRVITEIAGKVISWKEPLENGFQTATSTVSLLTAVRAGVADPVVELNSVSDLKEGDPVVITDTYGVNAEVATIGSIDSPTVTLNCPNGLKHSYLQDDFLKPPVVRAGDVNPIIDVASAVGLGVGDTVLISGDDSEKIPLSGISGNTVTLTGTMQYTYLEGDTLKLLNAGKTNDESVNLRSAKNFYVGAVIELDNGTNREYHTITNIEGNTITLDSALTNSYLEGDLVKSCEFKLVLSYQEQTEVFDNLSMNNAVPNYLAKVINEASELVKVTDLEAGSVPPFNQPSNKNGLSDNLKDGSDGESPTEADYIGEDLGPNKRTGIESLVDVDQISIIAIPGRYEQAIQNAMISHCELLKDRFAILDPPKGSDVQEIQNHRGLYDSKYTALYYPWIKVYDALTEKNILVPPSGQIAGIYARSDTERGVHKAPANEVVRGAVGVEVKISKGEQDILNPLGVDCIRPFPGRGIRVWGARTISSDSLWKYINVRRLFLFLEESIDEGTQWVVFEPNDEKLWSRVNQTITQFLTRVWKDGALMGTTPEEAFFVKCDRTTMTQDDIDNGRLIVMIGVAPVKPAEFVVFRIAQWQGGSEVSE